MLLGSEQIELTGVARVIAIGSCKGGVGKTTISVNLAMALRRQGFDVGLFDADLYGPNVPLMLGIRNKMPKNPIKMHRGGVESLSFIPLYRKSDEPYIHPVRKYGLQVMSLGLWFGEEDSARDPGSLGGQLVKQVLKDVQWGDLDILIIDLPPGTGDLIQSFLGSTRIDGMVVVTTPQEMSLLDTGRSIDLFRHLNIPILGRIENLSHIVCPHCGKHINVFENKSSDWRMYDDINLLGSIPLDESLGRPVDAHHPFTQAQPNTPAALAIIEAAKSVLSGLESRGGNTYESH